MHWDCDGWGLESSFRYMSNIIREHIVSCLSFYIIRNQTCSMVCRFLSSDALCSHIILVLNKYSLASVLYNCFQLMPFSYAHHIPFILWNSCYLGGAAAFSWAKGNWFSVSRWWNYSWSPANKCLHKVELRMNLAL